MGEILTRTIQLIPASIKCVILLDYMINWNHYRVYKLIVIKRIWYGFVQLRGKKLANAKLWHSTNQL